MGVCDSSSYICSYSYPYVCTYSYSYVGVGVSLGLGPLLVARLWGAFGAYVCVRVVLYVRVVYVRVSVSVV